MTVVLPRVPHAPFHETAGLPGFPAIDVFGKPGEPVRLDAAGKVTKLSGHPCSDGGQPGGAYGRSIYVTTDDGVYFLTHFDQVRVKLGDRISATTILGTICDSAVSHKPGTSHIHEGFHRTTVPPEDRRYNVVGPKGGTISKGKSANAIVENVEGWLRTHDVVTIRRVH